MMNAPVNVSKEQRIHAAIRRLQNAASNLAMTYSQLHQLQTQVVKLKKNWQGK